MALIFIGFETPGAKFPVPIFRSLHIYHTPVGFVMLLQKFNDQHILIKAYNVEE